MLFVNPNADYSASGLRAVRHINKMPSEGLVALYTMDDAVIGQAVRLLQDKSGRGNDAPLLAGLTAPTQQASGVAIAAAANAVFATPLRFNARKRTFLIATKMNSPASGGAFSDLWGSSMRGNRTLATGAQSASPAGSQRLNHSWGATGLSFGLAGGMTATRNTLTSDAGGGLLPLNAEAIVAVIQDLDAVRSTGLVMPTGQTGFSNSTTDYTAAAQTYYDGVTDRGTLDIGLWHNTGTPEPTTSPIATLRAIAIYDAALTSAQMSMAMRGMQRILADKGITI